MGVGTEVNHIMGPGAILNHTEYPVLSLTCRRIITGYHRGTREYPMDISRTIGEDGSGKDIGKGMRDGGKADTMGLIEETTLDPIVDVADLHLHRPEGETIETAALTAGKACYRSQVSGHRVKTRGQKDRGVKRES